VATKAVAAKQAITDLGNMAPPPSRRLYWKMGRAAQLSTGRDACFIVRDANGHALAYVYFEEELEHRSAAYRRPAGCRAWLAAALGDRGSTRKSSQECALIQRLDPAVLSGAGGRGNRTQRFANNTSSCQCILAEYIKRNVFSIEGMMTKAITFSLASIAIFGVTQTSSVAQDCYFNNITFQPPNSAVCYQQQSVSSSQTSSIGNRGRRGVLNRHARH
jgi:hypothetical protein